VKNSFLPLCILFKNVSYWLFHFSTGSSKVEIYFPSAAVSRGLTNQETVSIMSFVSSNASSLAEKIHHPAPPPLGNKVSKSTKFDLFIYIMVFGFVHLPK